ncbi:Olfactory receptor 14I1 [Fukomys damarensis]|uniref:Olfactory receptor n=1 Tax=Fukomys damarensis TaxID=885580 RepID=A0A091EK33_FUKDA|nr:Olfactory receptor 14I1 [Fukomys damarensis]
MDNLTVFTEFLLMDVTGSRELQVLQGVLFLVIYLGALTGNLVTVTVIVTDTCLHSPMYFFISNVALLDLGSISVVVLKVIVNSMTGNKTISLTECATQIFLYVLFAAVEIALLVVMSYDRYMAICHPLHYGLIITPSLCSQATAGSWASGVVYSAVHTGALFRLPFTKTNVIQQYFCDIPQILRISSSDVQFSEFVIIVVCVCLVLSCNIFIFISYINIFSTVLKIRSVEARNKAISTCTPQLVILLVFFISVSVAVLGPTAQKPSLKNLLTAMFYTMTPVLFRDDQALHLPNLEKRTERSCERTCCLPCALCTRSSTQAEPESSTGTTGSAGSLHLRTYCSSQQQVVFGPLHLLSGRAHVLVESRCGFAYPPLMAERPQLLCHDNG